METLVVAIVVMTGIGLCLGWRIRKGFNQFPGNLTKSAQSYAV